MTGTHATRWNTEQADDVVARFCRAAEDRDDAELQRALADHVELPSPISGRMVFRGRDDVAFLLGAVFACVTEIRWIEIVGESRRRVAFAEARIGPFPLTDALVIELADERTIGRLQPHIRPWTALTMLGLILGAKLLTRPRILARGFRRTPLVQQN